MTMDTLSAWIGRLLHEQTERPRLVIAMAPVAAIMLGVTQLIAARGAPNAAAGVATGVALLAYLALAIAVYRDERFVQPSWVLAVTLVSFYSTLIFPMLTDRGPDVLAWWFSGNLALALVGYLCRPRQVLIAIAALIVHGAIVISSTVGLTGNLSLLALGLCGVLLPGLFTMRLLGQARTAELAVREESWQDSATGVLSLRGLEHELERMTSAGTAGEFSLLAVRIDGFAEISDAWGFTVAEQVRVRVARALSRALRRDHAVARAASDVFAVLSLAPGEQTAAMVRELARSADDERAVTVSVGAVTELPAATLDAALLRQALEQARARIPAAPAYDQQVVGPFDHAVASVVAAPTGTAPTRRRAWRSPTVSTAASRQLGLATVALAVLCACTPLTGMSIPVVTLGFHLLLLLLAGGGAVLALSDRSVDVLHRPLLALTILAVALVVPLAVDSATKAAVLALLAVPGLFAGLVLRTTDFAITLVLLPFMLLADLTAGPGRIDPAIGYAGFIVITAALGLAHGLRRQHEAARTELAFANAQDPLTGLLTRAGLRDHADQFPRGTDAVVVFVDVDGVEEVRRAHGSEVREQTLQMIARVLSSLAGRTGAAARVASEQFVILLPESVRLTTVRRTIDHALAQLDPPVGASVGHAFGKVGRDVDLWRLVEAADEARRGGRHGLGAGSGAGGDLDGDAAPGPTGQMITLSEHAGALRR